MAMAAHNKAAGFLPQDLVAGGLKTDFNAEFTDLYWDYFTYQGKDGAPGKTAFGLHVHFHDEEGAEDAQFYSAGNAADWQPSADKSQPIPMTEGKGLNDSSNYAQFIKSVIEVGIPPNRLNSVKDLIGGNFFMSRVAAPTRAGLESDDGKKRTVLVCKKLNRAPWDAKKTAGKKGAKAETAGAGSQSGEDHGVPEEIAEQVSEIIGGLLSTGDYPDGIALKQVMPALMKGKVLQQEAYAGNKGVITKAILNQGLLASLPGIKFENGVINFG